LARLLSRLPGAVFPRARRLYFDETPALVRVSAERFAVVHGQGPAPGALGRLPAGVRDLRPTDLAVVAGETWFRQGGAFASFTAPAVYERPLPPPQGIT
jgi:hypothetical protein